ncbi:MAG: hypothetical protein P8169_12420 [Chloroflexota bacterium]
MNTAGRLYRLLLHLYPAEHRETYGEAMLQHAQDLERDARDRGRLAAAALALRLIGDGILNAGKEQWAALRASHFDPVPWPAVLMAAVPGLWMALTRRHADLFGPALNVLGVVYIALFALIPPIRVWRRRRFPVWALLPLGMLAWALTFMAGTSLAALAGPVRLPGLSMAATTILNGMLVAGIFYTMLRGGRIPRSALIVVGLILLSGLLPLVQLSQRAPGFLQPHEILAAALFEPLQALMLVAVGLLAARRYNVLALLAVFGGTMLLFGDSDYLWGSPYRDWPGLPLYMAGMVFLYPRSRRPAARQNGPGPRHGRICTGDHLPRGAHRRPGPCIGRCGKDLPRRDRALRQYPAQPAPGLDPVQAHRPWARRRAAQKPDSRSLSSLNAELRQTLFELTNRERIRFVVTTSVVFKRSRWPRPKMPRDGL